MGTIDDYLARLDEDEAAVIGRAYDAARAVVPEAELEGAPDAVDAVIAWAHEGPRYARVSEVTVTDAAPHGDSGDVEIRPTH